VGKVYNPFIRKMKEVIKKIWGFLNKPLCVIAIVAIITLILYLNYGQHEKIKCTLTISLKEEVAIDKFGMSEEKADELAEVYRNLYRYELFFDNYQEALAYRQILADQERDGYWFKFNFGCEENKTIIPTSFKEYITKS